ncbi:helix-turn-helix transcriptional regulator [Variovorax sp. ZT5P49]|uniref:helix-turn-helix transcriptional regulator n=1 Tax=Variovorax sp. ZT5P49 TaxID=3443733 RepID=UPI003F47F006
MHPESKHPASRILPYTDKRAKSISPAAICEAGTPASGTRYVRLPELRKMVPWSPATIWRHSKNPASKFPKSIKLSARVTAWNRAAVEAFLAEREAA